MRMRRYYRWKAFWIIGFVTIFLLMLVMLSLAANMAFFKIGPLRSAHKTGKLQFLVEDFIEDVQTDVNYNEDELNEVLREFESRAYFDTRGIYKVLPHVQVATRWDLNSRPLCVAVQSSLDSAHMIVEQATNWPGIISFALFAAGSEVYLAISYLKYLKFCFAFIEEQVNVHIVYPAYIKLPTNVHSTMDWNCTKTPEETLQQLLKLRSRKTKNWRQHLLYPQNLLRNVARDHCQNEWITCVDMDMLFPSPDNGEHDIAESLEEFLTSSEAISCKNCAFVLPTYEIKMDIRPVPRNKTELLQFVNEGNVRQFHNETYPEGQEMSDLNTWEKLCVNDSEVSIAYAAKPFEWKYEPIYIARRGTPSFDERYVGYGTVRVEQAFEMFLAGYKHWVLDNVFLIHRGFKKKGYISRNREK